MVSPITVLRSIKEAIKSSGRLPDATTYALFEVDMDGGQSDLHTPVVEITTVETIRNDTMNTDFVGHATDDSGNHIGRIYRAPFEMPVDIRVITAEGDGFDADEMGKEIRFALYQYEDRQEDKALPDPDSTSGSLSDVTRFQIDNGEPSNDLGMTFALRGWRQTLDVWFEEVINTAVEYGKQPYVQAVNAPEDGGWTGGTEIEIVFDATPNTDSDADTYD